MSALKTKKEKSKSKGGGGASEYEEDGIGCNIILSFMYFAFVTNRYLRTEPVRELKHVWDRIWNRTGCNEQTSAGHNQNIWEKSKDLAKGEAFLSKSPKTHLLRLGPPLPPKLGLMKPGEAQEGERGTIFTTTWAVLETNSQIFFTLLALLSYGTICKGLSILWVSGK